MPPGNFTQRYDDQALLDMVRDVSRQLGRTPSRKALDEVLGWAAGQTIEARFGSYARACELVGLKPNPRRGGGEHRYSEGAIRTAYARIKAICGRPPSVRAWERQRRPSEPVQVTLRKRYGSWTEFIDAMEEDEPKSQLKLRSSGLSARRAKNQIPA